MAIVTRFAPSPTGRLHLGHALSAWVASDLARNADGRFLLRMEDIDSSRVRPEYEDGIIEDLQWLGLAWDGDILRQSDRQEAYQAAFDRLQEQGLLYPCFCTRKDIQAELEAMGGAPHEHGAVYPRICKRLSQEERMQKITDGIPHAWRLNAQHAAETLGALTFEDQIHGTIQVDAERLGDVVINRKDIGVSYHLAVVVDDAFQDISLVSRGEDLLPSTHVHRLLQAALVLPEPVYHHHRLMVDEEGRRLAKRCDALSIESLRLSGHSPAEILERIKS